MSINTNIQFDNRRWTIDIGVNNRGKHIWATFHPMTNHGKNNTSTINPRLYLFEGDNTKPIKHTEVELVDPAPFGQPKEKNVKQKIQDAWMVHFRCCVSKAVVNRLTLDRFLWWSSRNSITVSSSNVLSQTTEKQLLEAIDSIPSDVTLPVGDKPNLQFSQEEEDHFQEYLVRSLTPPTVKYELIARMMNAKLGVVRPRSTTWTTSLAQKIYSLGRSNPESSMFDLDILKDYDFDEEDQKEFTKPRQEKQSSSIDHLCDRLLEVMAAIKALLISQM